MEVMWSYDHLRAETTAALKVRATRRKSRRARLQRGVDAAMDGTARSGRGFGMSRVISERGHGSWVRDVRRQAGSCS